MNHLKKNSQIAKLSHNDKKTIAEYSKKINEGYIEVLSELAFPKDNHSLIKKDKFFL